MNMKYEAPKFEVIGFEKTDVYVNSETSWMHVLGNSNTQSSDK